MAPCCLGHLGYEILPIGLWGKRAALGIGPRASHIPRSENHATGQTASATCGEVIGHKLISRSGLSGRLQSARNHPAASQTQADAAASFACLGQRRLFWELSPGMLPDQGESPDEPEILLSLSGSCLMAYFAHQESWELCKYCDVSGGESSPQPAQPKILMRRVQLCLFRACRPALPTGCMFQRMTLASCVRARGLSSQNSPLSYKVSRSASQGAQSGQPESLVPRSVYARKRMGALQIQSLDSVRLIDSGPQATTVPGRICFCNYATPRDPVSLMKAARLNLEKVARSVKPQLSLRNFEAAAGSTYPCAWDTPGTESRAFRMQSRCDTTTPCAPEQGGEIVRHALHLVGPDLTAGCLAWHDSRVGLRPRCAPKRRHAQGPAARPPPAAPAENQPTQAGTKKKICRNIRPLSQLMNWATEASLQSFRGSGTASAVHAEGPGSSPSVSMHRRIPVLGAKNYLQHPSKKPPKLLIARSCAVSSWRFRARGNASPAKYDARTAQQDCGTGTEPVVSTDTEFFCGRNAPAVVSLAFRSLSPHPSLLAVWSSGTILASSARERGLNSQNSPLSLSYNPAKPRRIRRSTLFMSAQGWKGALLVSFSLKRCCSQPYW